jgi:thymidylate synthase (FAD)
MKLIEPKVELIQQAPGLVGMYKHIERCARTCYKSEDKITEDSYKKMYDNLVQRGHLAMLEHGTIYLKVKGDKAYLLLNRYDNNAYSKVTYVKSVVTGTPNFEDFPLNVTTNLRVIIENHWEDDLEFICEPTEFHEKRITLKFTTNIGVTREGNRHRVNSIAEESTRYCNYTKEKH